MNWTFLDYALAGALAALLAGLTALAMMKSRSLAYRAGAALATLSVITVFLATGAVGIIGDPDEKANLLYLATLGVPVLGALMARFEASGMARATFATAFALMGVGAVVLTLRLGADTHNWLLGVFLGSVGFGGMFATSGWLFLQAAKPSRRALA